MKLVIALVLALAGTAYAQETGGHMGGGDWGGGGGGGGHSSGGGVWSSGGGSSPSWNHDSGWNTPSIPTYTPPTYHYTPPDTHYTPSTGDGSGSGIVLTQQEIDDFTRMPDPDTGFFGIAVPVLIAMCFLIVIGGFIKEFLGIDSFFSFLRPRPTSGTVPAEFFQADVSVLRVAIDGRARKFIQTALKQIANNSDTSTRDGRASMLAQVAKLLRQLRDAWVYGGAHNEPMGALADVKATYDRHVDDARTRFAVETISNVQGVKTSQASHDIQRRSDEGEGLILVTLVIAARTELFTVQRIADGEDLRKALDGAGHLDADQLVAIDVIWQPSEENDRMSSMELEARYPAPMLIPILGALVGKTFCAYCAGPFPAELQSCPHCGAPARERAA